MAPKDNVNTATCTTNTAASVCHSSAPLPLYTRNLIATDGLSYSLLLLCWNPYGYSPIHNHPGDGCWMRVVSGAIHEVRYTTAARNKTIKVSKTMSSSSLVPTQERTCGPHDDVVFIADDVGYHKVGNPSRTMPAMSLHLYSPPPQSCRAWMREDAAPYQADLTSYHSIVDPS
jgi:cysteine dioxygenase